MLAARACIADADINTAHRISCLADPCFHPLRIREVAKKTPNAAFCGQGGYGQIKVGLLAAAEADFRAFFQ